MPGLEVIFSLAIPISNLPTHSPKRDQLLNCGWLRKSRTFETAIVVYPLIFAF
jgi:hypothetical protein